MLDKLEKDNNHIYITGDFNCDILLTDKNAEQLKTLFLSLIVTIKKLWDADLQNKLEEPAP